MLSSDQNNFCLFAVLFCLQGKKPHLVWETASQQLLSVTMWIKCLKAREYSTLTLNVFLKN